MYALSVEIAVLEGENLRNSARWRLQRVASPGCETLGYANRFACVFTRTICRHRVKIAEIRRNVYFVISLGSKVFL